MKEEIIALPFIVIALSDMLELFGLPAGHLLAGLGF